MNMSGTTLSKFATVSSAPKIPGSVDSLVICGEQLHLQQLSKKFRGQGIKYKMGAFAWADDPSNSVMGIYVARDQSRKARTLAVAFAGTNRIGFEFKSAHHFLVK